MYNFGIASALKTWFDYILRAGVTFRYTENGPEGLLPVRKAVVIETPGGLYSEGPGVASASQAPHRRTLRGVMGITDVTFVRASWDESRVGRECVWTCRTRWSQYH